MGIGGLKLIHVRGDLPWESEMLPTSDTYEGG